MTKLMCLLVLLTKFSISYALILIAPNDVRAKEGNDVTILWSYANPTDILTVTWTFNAGGTSIKIMEKILPTGIPTPQNNFNCIYNSTENGGITIKAITPAQFGTYKIAVLYATDPPAHDEVLVIELEGCLICLLCLVYKILSGTGIGVTLLHVTISVILIKFGPKRKVVLWKLSHVDWGVSVGGFVVHSFSLIVGAITVAKNGDCRKCPIPVCDIVECDRCWKLGLASLVLGGIFLVVTIFFIILRKVSDKGKQSNDGKKDGASDQEMMGQPNNSL